MTTMTTMMMTATMPVTITMTTMMMTATIPMTITMTTTMTTTTTIITTTTRKIVKDLFFILRNNSFKYLIMFSFLL